MRQLTQVLAFPLEREKTAGNNILTKFVNKKKALINEGFFSKF